MEMDIRHFAHKHVLRHKILGGRQYCKFCQRTLDGGDEAYACYLPGCVFYIDKQCAELPREVNHPFHPQHLLIIKGPAPYAENFRCNACGNRYCEFAYWCSLCECYYLCVKCASLMPLEALQNSGSGSNSYFICKKTIDDYEFGCFGCKEPLLNLVYFDPNSGFLLHESCTNLPEEINHPFHPLHPLTLSSDGSELFKCYGCGRTSWSFHYYCSVCEFFLGISCAFLIPTNEHDGSDHNGINHDLKFSHSHQLIHCIRDRKIPLNCTACELPLDKSVYICLECHIVQHESCAAMPQKLQKHPLHLQHQLILSQYPISSAGSGYFFCDLCYTRTKGFSYACSDCRFQVEPRCALSVPPAINCELHSQHPLAYIEMTNETLRCNHCKRSCHTHFFRCVQCRFNLHVYCIPELPNSVKHDCHLHPLVLTRTPIKDLPDEDEDAELYCNACEERRKLVDPTYYCADCHFVAHPHCVTSEVLKCLGTEWPFEIEEHEDDAELDKEIERLGKEVDGEREKLRAMEKEVDKQRKRFGELRTKLDLAKARRAPYLAFDRFGGF